MLFHQNGTVASGISLAIYPHYLVAVECYRQRSESFMYRFASRVSRGLQVVRKLLIRTSVAPMITQFKFDISTLDQFGLWE